MREISAKTITEAVAKLCQEANYYLGEDVVKSLEESISKEESPLGISVLKQLLENARIAREEAVPICQDTGSAVVFVEVGQEVHIVDGLLREAIDAGVAKGYIEGYLRASMLSHPLNRKNTGNNTPAIIYTEIVPGNHIKITVVPKGGGGENMSSLKMLKPSDGVEGVKNFVVEAIKQAGSNPCPPLVVGVGIGGTFEQVALLAKKALIRPIFEHSSNPDNAKLEQELLERINNTGIGPQGLGGRTTALWVNVETFPAHIASLPVAININCHACRHKEVIL
ncbi:MAG: L(+)-tartrate dehydratase subunit alpha [candidate division WS2 bacterium]|uniref:L(+)-tartrate dehydratase subunit alpha n=1 Tax=Psychracetigena formicireducens TaxID=2986056 RepID=A0A9E2BF16_PSYF1|nr:L(+)-tartrate dehydratase subunit alpha [Candidatus Psychracetigena formicireducens]MBT9144421.1 L(+)-tartrate dehydratase subunit alpha [Candidatus Psychracetigena formicireducens]